MKRGVRVACAAVALFICAGATFAQQPPAVAPGARVLLDAHNCYPYQGRWAERIDRALGTGMPLAIEQDLEWVDGKSIVSHGKPFTGVEPTLDEYFFARVAPALREAAKRGEREDWPLVVLNIDFKNSSPEHCRVVWDELKQYEDILTTAEKTAVISEVSPIVVGPLLVLTSGAGGQYDVFYGDVPVGGRLLLFGAAETSTAVPEGLSGSQRAEFVASIPPAQMLPQPADNFRRWWNNPWQVVEAGGAPRGGDWTAADEARLGSLVGYGHDLGYLVRFYTLDGFDPLDNQGWSSGYNFGSSEAAALRWRASIAAGTDFVATDMYEAFAAVLAESDNHRRNEQ